MTAISGAGPRHAAHRRPRGSVAELVRRDGRVPAGGAHRARHAQRVRKPATNRFDRVVLAIAGWLLALRIAMVGEHVIEEF